jgi:hypothetical protein
MLSQAVLGHELQNAWWNSVRSRRRQFTPAGDFTERLVQAAGTSAAKQSLPVMPQNDQERCVIYCAMQASVGCDLTERSAEGRR